MKAMQAFIVALVIFGSVASVLAEEKAYTLQDAYRSALQTNEVMKIAEENVIQSESRIDQAWTYLYPRVTAQSGYIQYNNALSQGSFVFQPLGQFQAGLVLTQPLYTGGRTLAALRTAQALREASSTDLTFKKQETMLNAAQAYYGVIKSEKMVEVSRRSLERIERHKKVTEREAATRKSKANLSALLRATTLVTQARINIVRADDGIKIARERLNLATKLPIDARVTEPMILEMPKTRLEEMRAVAVANRPDYAGQRQNLKVAEENVTIVRGAHYPQVSAEGGVQYQNSHPDTPFDTTIYYGALRLQVPIFEGGLMKAETSEARSKVRQAELSSALLKRTIETQVDESYINLQTISSVLETAKMQLGYAKENFDAVEALYNQGLLTSLSMIDAEEALSLAEQEVVNATYDRQVAILTLQKSMGILGSE